MGMGCLADMGLCACLILGNPVISRARPPQNAFVKAKTIDPKQRAGQRCMAGEERGDRVALSPEAGESDVGQIGARVWRQSSRHAGTINLAMEMVKRIAGMNACP